MLRFGSPAVREKLLAFNESRSRYGSGKAPSRLAQVTAVLAVMANVFWLTRS